MSILDTKSRWLMDIAWVTAFVLFVLPMNCLCEDAVPKGGQLTFGGNWWQSANVDEQTGFLYALDDCLTFDRKPPLRFDDSWINYEQKIGSYYALSPANMTTSVQGVFERFGKNAKASTGSESKARYGDEFWRAHNELARRGFIEGFTSCRAKEPNSPKWSKPTDYYLHLLDDLYNADDRHGENAPEYTGSVASALRDISDK